MTMKEPILILQNKHNLKPSKWTLDSVIDEVNKHSPMKVSKVDSLSVIADAIDLYTNFLVGEIVQYPRTSPSVDWHPSINLDPI